MPIHRCPSTHELGAALRVARALSSGGSKLGDARASYDLIPSGGLYGSADYVAAEALLRRCGLIDETAHRLTPTVELLELIELPRESALELLLFTVIEREPPNWIFTLGHGDTDLPLEAIPDADWSTFESIVKDPVRRETYLLALGSRFSSEYLAALRAAGEEFVVTTCRALLEDIGRRDLAKAVRRVSLLSDQLGYDVITPTVAGPPWRLGVKTTKAMGASIKVVVTRNETRTGLHDSNWAMVICLARPNGQLEIAGWCRAEGFASFLPKDQGNFGAWISASLALDSSYLRPGIPDLVAGQAS